MPTLSPIPIPLEPIYIARQIETVILAALDTSPALKTSGDLGVVTREKGKRQPGDSPHRDYGGKADLPAIWLRCENTGSEDGLACGTESLIFDLIIGVVTEDASTEVAYLKNEDVQSAAVRFVRNHIRAYRHTWLEIAGLHGYVPSGTTSMETPQQNAATANRFTSLSSIPINVEVSLEVW